MSPIKEPAPCPTSGKGDERRGDDYTMKCHYTIRHHICGHRTWTRPRVIHIGCQHTRSNSSLKKRCDNMATKPREVSVYEMCSRCRPTAAALGVKGLSMKMNIDPFEVLLGRRVMEGERARERVVERAIFSSMEDKDEKKKRTRHDLNAKITPQHHYAEKDKPATAMTAAMGNANENANSHEVAEAIAGKEKQKAKEQDATSSTAKVDDELTTLNGTKAGSPYKHKSQHHHLPASAWSIVDPPAAAVVSVASEAAAPETSSDSDSPSTVDDWSSSDEEEEAVSVSVSVGWVDRGMRGTSRRDEEGDEEDGWVHVD